MDRTEDQRMTEYRRAPERWIEPGERGSLMSADGIKRAYVRVVLIWLVVMAALWWLQHAFL